MFKFSRLLVLIPVVALLCGMVSDKQRFTATSNSFTPTTWNPSDKGGGITLSGGNLVVTGSGASTDAIRSVTNYSIGKYYWEITLTTDAGAVFIGLANSTQGLTSNLNGANSISYRNNTGTINVNGSSPATIPVFTTGDIVSIALDFTNTNIWFRVNGGNWNNSGVANPATNVGGYSFLGTTTPLYAAASTNINTSVITANFGATAFTYTVPSGFTAGF